MVLPLWLVKEGSGVSEVEQQGLWGWLSHGGEGQERGQVCFTGSSRVEVSWRPGPEGGWGSRSESCLGPLGAGEMGRSGRPGTEPTETSLRQRAGVGCEAAQGFSVLWEESSDTWGHRH